MPLLVQITIEAGDEDPQPEEADPHVGGRALLVLPLIPLVALLPLKYTEGTLCTVCPETIHPHGNLLCPIDTQRSNGGQRWESHQYK
jgi:hypothetical protein